MLIPEDKLKRVDISRKLRHLDSFWVRIRTFRMTLVCVCVCVCVCIYIYIYIDGNYTRMLRAILNNSWRQHPTRHQLYGHLPHITKTIQVRRTRHAGHCWRSKDELIRDGLLWTPTYGQAKAGRPARLHIAAM